MVSFLFNTFIYNPLYNGIVFLLGALPGIDLGVAVILFTILVRLVLFPLSRKAVEAQLALKKLEPLLTEIKEKHKNNKEEQARRTMALYREYHINPFSSILLVLAQIPIIFALYFIFLRSGFPDIRTDILYSFVSVPEHINTLFLGLIEMGEQNIILSVLAGATQFLQAYLMMPLQHKDTKKPATFATDLARGMQMQMRYVLPVIVAFISYSLSSVIALYWTTSNLFTIGQEIVVRRRAQKKEQPFPS